MSVGEKIFGIGLIELGQGEDEVVHDLVGSDGRNTVIFLDQRKGAGGGQGEEGSGSQNARETHIDNFFSGLAMKRMDVTNELM